MIDPDIWNSRIAEIENHDFREFEAHILKNPYAPTIFKNDFEAFESSMRKAKLVFSTLGEFGETCLRIFGREENSNNPETIANRSKLIKQISLRESIDLNNLCAEQTGFDIPLLTLRNSKITIFDRGSKEIVTYPKLTHLQPELMTLCLRAKSDLSEERLIVTGIINLLKVYLIHPYKDGNGRSARLILTASLVNALNLKYIPFVDPFFRARNLHLSNCIMKYLADGDLNPFLFAVSSAIRDALEI